MTVRALVVAVALAAAAVPTAAARAGEPGVVDEPVWFTVTNINRSIVPCPTDGRPYHIAGRLVGPVGAHRYPAAVTLYVHGGLFSGQHLWHFRDVAGFDFATELAQAGHSSVIIDNLGYGESGLPRGLFDCFGGQADVTHQIIGALRRGAYQAGDAPSGPRFARVALAGHSGGALITEAEAVSFHDFDELIIMSWSSPDISTAVAPAFEPFFATCARGGEPKYPGSASGYAFVGPKPSDLAPFQTDVAPAVSSAILAHHEREPCGVISGVIPAVLNEQLLLRAVTVPVLLVFGLDDHVFPPPAGEHARAHFSGSADVTLIQAIDVGHSVQLSAGAPAVRAGLADWLDRHGS